MKIIFGINYQALESLRKHLLFICLFSTTFLVSSLRAVYHPDLLKWEEKLPLKNPELILEKLRVKVARKNRSAKFLWPDALIQVRRSGGDIFLLQGVAGRTIYTFDQLIPFPWKIIVNRRYWQVSYELSQVHYRKKKTQVEYWYWQFLLDIALLDFSAKIIAEQIIYVNQLVADAESKVVTGAPTSMLLTWQMEKVKLENSLMELRSDTLINLGQFKAIFGHFEEINTELSNKSMTKILFDMDKILSRWQWPQREHLKINSQGIWKKSPDQLTARQEVNLLKYKQELTKWELAPDFNLGLIYGDVNDFELTRNVRYGFKWRLPLAVFNKDSEIQAYKHLLEAKEEQYRRLEIEIIVDVQNTLIDINKNVASLKTYENNLRPIALQKLKEMEATFITEGKEKDFLLAFKELLFIDLTILKYRVQAEKGIVKLKLLGGLSWEEYNNLVLMDM